MPYTKAQEVALTNAAPITFETAGEFAAEFGVSQRSVIAKVMSLGLEYIPKAKVAKRPRGMTKAELVAEIAAKFGAEVTLPGLEKAPAQTLEILAAAL